ncbi:hypothetical protein CK203_074096 [Vitis vinifera]|uniref:Nodulin-like domain-containing protein n=1 Tax=Vitis vinifera TaxID=29760 RepID=A0A438E839_VITVI|nr:hypothetical protein CK203_074096 [Vitis vinifera]
MVTLKAGSRPPWVGLGAAVWVQIASGNAYTFPLYSHSLKSVLGFNQHQLTMLGVATTSARTLAFYRALSATSSLLGLFFRSVLLPASLGMVFFGLP